MFDTRLHVQLILNSCKALIEATHALPQIDMVIDMRDVLHLQEQLIFHLIQGKDFGDSNITLLEIVISDVIEQSRSIKRASTKEIS